MTDTQRQRRSAPTSIDSVKIRSTNSAALDLDVDIVVAEDLGFYLNFGSEVDVLARGTTRGG
jgi:hypothetical protein